MFIKVNGQLIEEATNYPVHLEIFLGVYTTKYYYTLTGRGTFEFFEEINKTYLRNSRKISLKDLTEDKIIILLEVLNSFDADAERRRAFWQ